MTNAWRRPMTGRRSDEAHRAATPLELLFDLCFVVAVAQAAGRLHHSLAEDHVEHAVGHYLMVFFAIWWAWMNFTWFASAYDTDDTVYRLTTLVQIAGALVLAEYRAQFGNRGRPPVRCAAGTGRSWAGHRVRHVVAVLRPVRRESAQHTADRLRVSPSRSPRPSSWPAR